MTPGESAAALEDWRRRSEETDAERDPLVRAARKAGLNIRQIGLASGLTRKTVYKILGKEGSTAKESTMIETREHYTRTSLGVNADTAAWLLAQDAVIIDDREDAAWHATLAPLVRAGYMRVGAGGERYRWNRYAAHAGMAAVGEMRYGAYDTTEAAPGSTAYARLVKGGIIPVPADRTQAETDEAHDKGMRAARGLLAGLIKATRG